MNTQSQNAIIIGANISALTAAQALTDTFAEIIMIEERSELELSSYEQQGIHEIEAHQNIHVMFNTAVRGYLSNGKCEIVGATIQSFDNGLETLRSRVIIDATDMHSNTPRWLQCIGYESVPYREQQIMLTAPMLHTVTIESYNYHKMSALPRGLYVIGDALSNIGQVAGQLEKLAQIQSVLLKQYLTSGQSNLKFQKNVARIISIVMKEYVYSAHHRAGIERQLETRGFATASQ
mgnify:CR=1 FL=1